MPDPALSLYETLRAVEHRDVDARQKVGLPSSRREAASRPRRRVRPPRTPGAVASLLRELREAGAQHQVEGLVDRLPATGMAAAFLEQQGHWNGPDLGGETDGSPARPRGWEDLD